eukprot:gene3871-4126_t
MQASSNTAAALISSAGAGPNVLQLLRGTRLHNNTVSWLLVADSMVADAQGQSNLLAPQPSELTPYTLQGARYTTHGFIGRLRNLSLQELGSEAQQPRVLRFVGAAPQGQAPLQVQLQGAAFTGNTVLGGLMWLRLVNTTMTHVTITSNSAIMSPPGVAQASSSRGAAHFLQPPGICDMESQSRALVQVHGPSAFDVYRSNISSNLHPSGAIIRVTDGLGLASLRSTVLSNNTATAVLRFEGRTWVLNTYDFFNGTLGLDANLYRLAEDTSEDAFKVYQLYNYKKQQITNNTVFHAVILAKGQRRDWRKFESARAKAVLQAQGDRDLAVKNVTLDTYAAVGWLTRCTLSGNRFMSGPVKGTFLPEGRSYVDALSVALSASLEDRAAWLQARKACESAVLEGIKDTSPKKHYIRPAVVTATFSINFLWGSFLDKNVGFQNVVSLHSTLTTVSLQLQRNDVRSSLVRMIDCDIKIWGLQLLDNTVASGSLMESDTVVGWFSQITLVGNNGSAAGTNGMRSINSTSGRTQDDAYNEAVADLPGASVMKTWPIWGLTRLYLGEVEGINISSNRGPSWGFAVDISEFNLLSPLSNFTVAANEASGIRLISTLPWYDGQRVGLENVTVANNMATSEAGGLAIGGFESKVGKTMSVRVERCLFANNTPAAAGRNKWLVRGGGVYLMAPAEDRAGSTNTRGFLEKLTIDIVETVIEGNKAVEGGGLWSAWPTNITNCTIQNNAASLAGGGIFLRGLQQDKLGSDGYTNISHIQLSNNTAGFGGGVACDGCRAIVYSSNITDNRAAVDLRDLFQV